MALNHTNYGSERHDSWFEVEALTRTTRGSPRSEYSGCIEEAFGSTCGGER